MSSGSEPERDDTGLPPVDIEIPDDARELDRDVQAYHRELRALRRRRRSVRLHGVLAREGMVVPLLVCCLILALVAGTLLTLFTATSIDQNLPGTAGPRSTAGAARPSARPDSTAASAALSGGQSTASTPPAGPVPLITAAPGDVAGAEVTVGGKTTTASALRPAVLMVVPARCECDAAVAHLADLARGLHARAYVVGTAATFGQADQLASRIGHGLLAAVDAAGALSALHVTGLAAVLVSADGTVSYAQMLQGSKRLTAVVREARV